jgi:RNA polymerase sigma-70 factor (ECF subfamily)
VAVRELVEKAKRGDHASFDALVLGSIARTDAAARLILRDPERARDAVQDAYVRAWRDLPSLRDPDRFDAWLYRLVARSCYDELRRSRRRQIEVELKPIDHPAIADDQARAADRDMLDRALRGLEVHVRTTVILTYYLGMSLDEVADAVGVPLGTVKSRLHRGRERLRTALSEERTATSRELEGRTA